MKDSIVPKQINIQTFKPSEFNSEYFDEGKKESSRYVDVLKFYENKYIQLKLCSNSSDLWN
jgi:hypothetical protein